ncbi:MAG: phosphatase PAP2 family protein [Cyclobacteriaceae bacterium]|nr:phosphatase PAP2 family protein [Cyclobacteriaceae bacterium]
MFAPNKFLTFVTIIYAGSIAILFILGYSVGQVDMIKWFNIIHTPFLDQLFASLTLLGTAIIFIPFLVVAVFQRFSLAIGLVGNAILQSLVVSLFKRVLFPKAPRPIQFLDADTVHRVPGVSIHHWMSFPSGHTVTIFGLCVFVSLWTKNYWMSAALLLLAILVGVSRMYLTQHFPIDVATGAFFGSTIGAYTYMLTEYWNKSNWMNERINLPGSNRN